MLPKENSLTEKREYNLVQQKGNRAGTKALTIAYLQRGSSQPPRFGFVISNKTSPLAVVRNRIRRAIRETLRQNTIYVKPGYDIVFLAKPHAVKMLTEEIANDTIKTLIKAGLFKKN